MSALPDKLLIEVLEYPSTFFAMHPELSAYEIEHPGFQLHAMTLKGLELGMNWKGRLDGPGSMNPGLN